MKQQKFSLIKCYEQDIQTEVGSEIEILGQTGWYVKQMIHTIQSFNAKNKQGEDFVGNKHFYSIVFEKES
jgi:hypothetical protein